MVRYLLSKGADFDQADNSQNSPLHYAAAPCHLDVIKLLKTCNANFRKINQWGLGAIHVSIK
jgi:serine/threonine-protein phosphatase 6 regulatory ankyrin repeat subunit B